MMRIVQVICMVLCLFLGNLLSASSVEASPADTGNLAISTATGLLKPDNAQLRDDLIELLKDSHHRQELADYLEATRPVITRYQGYFETASNVALWSEEHIPFIGHLIGTVAISVTNHFFQKELQDLATTEVAQKFAMIRASGINVEIDMFQRGLSNYILNNGFDFSLLMNLQNLINEKYELHDFIRTIIKSSTNDYKPVDDANIIPKLDTYFNFK